MCRKKRIPYACLGKEALNSRLISIDDDTLVVSASNRYLFPEAVLARPCLFVVNYHGALLPKHPGRNAEAWAIYEGDAEGGITWHKVVADVDAGDVFVQKSVPITENTTSFSLLREYARLAQQSFLEIVDGLLYGSAVAVKQIGERDPVMYSWMRPNEGVLDVTWPCKKVSAFLRAFDYGPLHALGCPQVMIEGARYDIQNYKLDNVSDLKAQAGWVAQSSLWRMADDNLVIEMNLMHSEKTLKGE